MALKRPAFTHTHTHHTRTHCPMQTRHAHKRKKHRIAARRPLVKCEHHRSCVACVPGCLRCACVRVCVCACMLCPLSHHKTIKALLIYRFAEHKKRAHAACVTSFCRVSSKHTRYDYCWHNFASVESPIIYLHSPAWL